jgi:hypothetical protein
MNPADANTSGADKAIQITDPVAGFEFGETVDPDQSPAWFFETRRTPAWFKELER